MIPEPDPAEIARFEAWCRENFPGNCSHAFHRSRTVNLPALVAHTQRSEAEVRKLERQVWVRMQWRKAKRVLRSRELWISVACILGALLLLAWSFAGDVKTGGSTAADAPANAEQPRATHDRRREAVGLRTIRNIGQAAAPSGGRTGEITVSEPWLTARETTARIEAVTAGRDRQQNGGALVSTGAPDAQMQAERCSSSPKSHGQTIKRQEQRQRRCLLASSCRRAVPRVRTRGLDVAPSRTHKPVESVRRRLSDAGSNPAASTNPTTLAGVALAPDSVTHSAWRVSTAEPLCPVPFTDTGRPYSEECRQQALAQRDEQPTLRPLLALLLASWLVLLLVRRTESGPEDEGRLLPGWFPRRRV